MALTDDPLEVIKYIGGDVRLIHGINVNMCDAVCDEVDYLLSGVNDAGLAHSDWVVAEMVNDRLEALGNTCAGELDGS